MNYEKLLTGKTPDELFAIAHNWHNRLMKLQRIQYKPNPNKRTGKIQQLTREMGDRVFQMSLYKNSVFNKKYIIYRSELRDKPVDLDEVLTDV
jgi:hypothetical protein